MVLLHFLFITNSSSAATQRYINIALGENNTHRAKEIFSTSIIIHIIVAIILIILAESIGQLVLNKYLVIPPERMLSARILYQFSILSSVLGIMGVTYNASIVANENMSYYAFLNIFDCFSKTIIALCLSLYKHDKLILYGGLIVVSNTISFFLMKFYSNRKILFCHFTTVKDKCLFKEMISFSGWTLLSSVGSTCSNQVLAMIVNRFFGVIVNAALGIANQVNNAVYQLITNFQVAFQPQIIKSYAVKDKVFFGETGF